MIVKTETKDGLIVGRNGTRNITHLQMEAAGSGRTFVDGVGVRGGTINGGFVVETTDMERLCQLFLEARGFTVSRKETA